MAKTNISSFLQNEFSLEDLVNGRETTSFGMEDVALVNKLGLLSAITDTNNTDPTNFGIESAILLGESNQFGLYATQKLEEMNNKFAICAQIKQRYGVEGFDPFAFGAEGFVDGIKKVGKAIAEGFKRLVQVVLNFIRSVGNAIGSALALTQVKLYEKYKATTFEAGKGKEIKALVHKVKFPSYFASENTVIQGFASSLQIDVTALMNQVNNSNGGNATFNDGKLSSKFSKRGEEFMEKISSIAKTKSSPGLKGKDIKNLVIEQLFSESKPKSIKAGDFMVAVNKDSDGIKILSRESLDTCKILVKTGQMLVKNINGILKQVDAIMNNALKVAGTKSLGDDKETTKSSVSQVKGMRESMKCLNLSRTLCGNMSTSLLMSFSAYLRARGYTAAAVRSYVSFKEKK